MNSLGYMRKRELKCLVMEHPTGYHHSLYIQEAGFSLNKLEFRDAMLLQYDLPVPSLLDFCDNTVIGKTGDLVFLTHNEFCDLIDKMHQTSITEDNA